MIYKSFNFQISMNHSKFCQKGIIEEFCVQVIASSLLNNPCIGGLFSGTFLTNFQPLLLPLKNLLIFDESKQKRSFH